MAEQESQWQIWAAAEMFVAEPGNIVEPDNIYDARDGDGARLNLGDAHLEFFPHSNIVRYKDLSLAIEMLGVTSARMLEGSEKWFRIESENGDTKDALSFHGDSGTISFTREPMKKSIPTQERKEIEQVEMTGRVGKYVNFQIGRESGKGRLTFSLGVNAPGQPAQWQRVVFWDDQAAALSKTLNTGDTVRIAGKLNQRETQGPDGKKHQVAELVGNQLDVIRKARPQPNGR